MQCVSLRNAENPDEPSDVKKETNRKLPCIIDNQRQPVDQLFDGIKVALEESLTKYSPSLGRDAEYQKVSRISRLVITIILQSNISRPLL